MTEDSLSHAERSSIEVNMNRMQEERIRAARALVHESLAYVTKEAPGYRHLTRGKAALDHYISLCVTRRQSMMKPYPTASGVDAT